MKRNRLRAAAAVLVPATVVLLVLLAAGCGGGGGSNGVTGVYKLKAGSDFTATLTLKDGGEGTFSITEGAGIPITYKVEDDTVRLFGMDGTTALETGVFTITDKGLEDRNGNLYMKQ